MGVQTPRLLRQRYRDAICRGGPSSVVMGRESGPSWKSEALLWGGCSQCASSDTVDVVNLEERPGVGLSVQKLNVPLCENNGRPLLWIVSSESEDQ